MLDDDVWRYLPLGPAATVIVGVVGLGLLVGVALGATPGARRAAAALLALATAAVLATTLSGQDSGGGRSVSLRPGSGLRTELDNVNQALGLVNVLGNIVLFVPIGWLVASLTLHRPSTRLWRGVGHGALAGLLLCLGIEAAQYFLGRAADTDDVLLNAAGALLGAVGGALVTGAGRRGAAQRGAAQRGAAPRITEHRGRPVRRGARIASAGPPRARIR